jgi:hypothetical protein
MEIDIVAAFRHLAYQSKVDAVQRQANLQAKQF